MVTVDTISVSMLDSYCGDNSVIIIDLRSREEFEESHFKGAVNIPYEELEYAKRFPKSKTLILYCDRGGASLFAARELMKKGYRTKSVVCGFRAYKGPNLYFGGNHSRMR